MSRAYNVVDADGHVLEPLNLWTEYMDPALREKLTNAFLALDKNDPHDKEILDLQRTTRFIPTKVENYGAIETAARSAGLLK